MEKKKIKVLFIGNSYTYYNDMPNFLFKNEAEAAGYSADVTAVTKGGHSLFRFADPSDEQGQILRNVVNGQHYDFAVLQDQSLNPIKNEEQFLQGIEKIKSLIDAKAFILYATWGRNEGSPQLIELGLTREEMTDMVSTAYNKAGEIYGMKVAEVGKAFLEHARVKDRDELYDPDKSHPSAVGSAIAARVIFAKLSESIK